MSVKSSTQIYEESKGIFRVKDLKELLESEGKKFLYYSNQTSYGGSAKVLFPDDLFKKYGGIPLIIRQEKFMKQECQEHEYHLTSFWLVRR